MDSVVAVEDILAIHKYLINKNGIVQIVWVCKANICFSSDVLSCNLPNINPLKSVSRSENDSKVRPELVTVNSDEPTFYSYSFKIDKCSGSCNNINDPYAKISIPEIFKNTNLKVFNIMSRTNEKRYIKLHETCRCKCRLDASVYKKKQRSNEDKCRCECKESIEKGFIWNPYNCECDKSCDVAEYLD